MDVKPGLRLRSAVCDTELVVVRAGDPSVDLRCGGQAMLPLSEEPPLGLTITDESGTQLGKRYVHEPSGTEVLCSKAGVGGLSVGSEPLSTKAAKPLPSSD